MSSEQRAGGTAGTGPAIRASGLGKRYELFERPSDRLRQLLWGARHDASREFWALRDVEFEVGRGEAVGIVGRNGAGKSTLLQLVCGTVAPTTGEMQVNGRVAALLELGAGFNPEFSGIENVYLNGALLGLNRAQVDERLDDILAFADIGAFARQPVKTYSSGMFVRLAFAVATSVEPGILVIDEALSVGDGAFARKSFDRIMALKDAGATILFCSHAMYHVHALCSRALWLEGGRLKMFDAAPRVTAAYEASLGVELLPEGPFAGAAGARAASARTGDGGEDADADADADAVAAPPAPPPPGSAAIRGIVARMDGAKAEPGVPLAGHTGRSELEIRVRFAADPALPCPSVAVGIDHASGTVVASALSINDGVVLSRDAQGHGEAVLRFERLPLLRGDYAVSVILACERGLHVYEVARHAIALRMAQDGVEQGLVTLPHRWETGTAGR
jgi:lipopolysaccharide transport system ATP-binding protein